VMQFGFGGDLNNLHLPHTYPCDVVAFTGTHDSDTTVSWFNSRSDVDKEYCLEYLKSDGREISWDFIDALFASAADTTIVPLQDVLSLGGEARMNLPNSLLGNWLWRYTKHALNQGHGLRLEKLAERYGRIPRRNGRS
jgi:4-alpha-glucanotransferase